MFKQLMTGAIGLSFLAACEAAGPSMPTGIEGAFEQAKSNEAELRVIIQDMPKGGDIHNHLFGAVYAESWLRYAEEDNMCIDKDGLAIRFPTSEGCRAPLVVAGDALKDQNLRNDLIDRFSLRDFTPYAGWGGHDQFFRTFGSMAAMPSRFGDMVADTANLAGRQNIAYLELLHTMELFETILPMVAGLPMTGDAETDYNTLMESEFGKELPNMVARAIKDTDTAMAKVNTLLGCGSEQAQPGCDVEIRFQNQPVRTLPKSAVYAHNIFGWHLMEQDSRWVGTNLVAPEDDFISLRDYMDHMEQLGFLYDTLGPRNISLHAGELWLGLVHPKELRFHITEAIKTAKAKRIGHGTDIIFETDYEDLLKLMAEQEIMVEVNLTSSEQILGVKGDEHPYQIYREAGVPMALSTDDEGVARIDLTHEYIKGVHELGLGYDDLKRMTYNSLKYAFLDAETKARLIDDLDARFAEFEAGFK
ncbi:MAG: adenosine deaminase [Acidimicrobiales bacterium]|nr:adenosine deaminase [Hyphomonadaceae bacterium]RZV42451.1 MAG: adenosine deaminase [Acidimicrobiales bacterium]